MDLRSDKTFVLSHRFTSVGTFSVRVNVTDLGGGLGTANFRRRVTS